MDLFGNKKKLEAERQEVLTKAKAEADDILAKANDFYDAKKAELDSLKAELDERAEKLEAAQKEFKLDRQKTEELQTEFTKKIEMLRSDEKEFQQKKEALEAEKTSLSQKENDLVEREEALTIKAKELDLKSKSLADKEIELAEKAKTIAPPATDIQKKDSIAIETPQAADQELPGLIDLSEMAPTLDNLDKIPPKEPKIEEPMNKVHQAPNAMVGKAYHLDLSTLDIESYVEIQNILGLEEFGLSLSDDMASISGTPQKDGDGIFAIHYKLNDDAPASESLVLREIRMFINPDPRSLWKNLEPDEHLPFPKAHEDFKFLEYQGLQIYGASRRGRSHAHEGTYRDDDFLVEVIEDNFLLMAVADGAGSAKFSREGSRIACQELHKNIADKLQLSKASFVEKIKQYLNDTESAEFQRTLKEALYDIFGNSIVNVRNAINQAAENQETKLREFSTTLLFSLLTKVDNQFFIANYAIGDGVIANYLSEAQVELYTTPDGGEFAGQTRFLVMDDVPAGIWDRITMQVIDDFKGLFLMTDGISDPFFETDANLMKAEYWKKLYTEVELCLEEPGDDSKDKVLEWINFWSPGNHDDRTFIYMKRS